MPSTARPAVICSTYPMRVTETFEREAFTVSVKASRLDTALLRMENRCT